MRYWRQPLDKHRIQVPRGIVHLIAERCKGCGFCVEFCPQNVLELDKQDKAVAVRLEDCIACRMCELRCPDLAIEVVVEEEAGEGEKEAENKDQGKRKP